MFSRIRYVFREMWASSRRNLTLTVAAIVTSFISLLLFGVTMLIQRGFENQLSQWSGGVEMIVYLKNNATPEQVDAVHQTLASYPTIVDADKLAYCDIPCALSEADRLLAGDPTTRAQLTESTIVTNFKVVPVKGDDLTSFRSLSTQFRGLPGVYEVSFPGPQIDVLGKLKGFFGRWTILISSILLAVAVLLIWNTIRTAMFARRREIEVMKLVGATNWFIRIPFMLEGLLQGLLGSALASGALLTINKFWTNGVHDFPESSGFAAFVVTGGYLWWVVLFMIALGVVVGAIGSATAASRFLDV